MNDTELRSFENRKIRTGSARIEFHGGGGGEGIFIYQLESTKILRILSKDQMETLMRMISQMKDDQPCLDAVKFMWMERT